MDIIMDTLQKKKPRFQEWLPKLFLFITQERGKSSGNLCLFCLYKSFQKHLLFPMSFLTLQKAPGHKQIQDQMPSRQREFLKPIATHTRCHSRPQQEVKLHPGVPQSSGFPIAAGGTSAYSTMMTPMLTRELIGYSVGWRHVCQELGSHNEV